MLFDRIGGAEIADAAHLTARSVARHSENVSGSGHVRNVAVMESKFAAL